MHSQCDGQLALLDAVVFFAVSVVVSSVMLSYGGSSEVVAPDHGDGSADPDEVLRVFLNACIGSQVRILAQEAVIVPEREKVSTCLALEAEGLLGGLDPGLFDSLNDAYGVILRRITNPLYEPCLVVLDMDSKSCDAILMIPQNPGSGRSVLASSAVLPVGEHNCLVEVLLSAQSLSEPVDV